MRKIVESILLVVLIVCYSISASESKPLRIFNGVDTLLIDKRIGFDFIEQVACTSFFDYPGCHSHFYFNDYSDPNLHYDLRIAGLSYAVKMGNMNLDSVKIAPPDTIFDDNEIGIIDQIPPDSLFFRIGHSYFIKTGVDPRDQRIYFAKIRILNFRVIDSANRRVEMRFLWAISRNGSRDLTTSNLDTFNLNTPILSLTPSTIRKTTRKTVFRVVGDRFVVPQELVGTNAYLNVYDLAGKRLGNIEVGDRKTVDLRGVRKSLGAVVVRVGRDI